MLPLHYSVATQREPQCGANLAHPFVTQAGDSFTNSFLRDGYRIVQIDGASLLHAVFDIQDDLRGYAPDCGSDRGDGYGRKMADRTLPSEYDYGTLLIRMREPAKMNLAAVQSSGQAAASSHGRYSSARWGRAWYPLRSRSSRSSTCSRLRYSRNASRISADRFTFRRLAATSAALRSCGSKTTCIVSIVDFIPQFTPQPPLPLPPAHWFRSFNCRQELFSASLVPKTRVYQPKPRSSVENQNVTTNPLHNISITCII